MADYRFRLEGELLVLQLKDDSTDYYGRLNKTSWRDAKVEDIPLANVFDTSPRGYAEDGSKWNGKT